MFVAVDRKINDKGAAAAAAPVLFYTQTEVAPIATPTRGVRLLFLYYDPHGTGCGYSPWYIYLK
jgi:hypothetical protein